jgi:hypothetical protein
MYTPKNRILTNQYTNDNSLAFIGTQDYYTGFYHKTFDGKYFTGKTPNDRPTVELEKVVPTETNYVKDKPQSEIAYTDAPTIFDDLETPGYDEGMIVDYARINNINLDKAERLFVPYSQYPIPTEDDYKLGVFTRYFLIKINENRYLEVDQEMYKAITNQDSQYLWQPYISLKLQWTLAGDENYVATTNRNSILLAEKGIKRKGLELFLRKNYLKFYK